MPTLLLLSLALLAGAPEGHPPPDGARIEALIRDLGSDSWEVRSRAREALTQLGEAARPHLERALRSDDLEIRRAAAALLQEIREAAIPDLAAFLRQRDTDIVETPEYAALLERGAEVAPRLLEAIRGENATYPRYDYYTLRNAFRLLEALAVRGDIGSDFLPRVLELLDTDNANCRTFARPLMRRLARGPLLPMLVEAYGKDPAPRRRARLLEMIFDENRTLGMEKVPAALEDEAAAVRLAAARLIRFQSREEDIPLLIRATADPDPDVRAAVVQALARHPTSREARAAVRVALEDPDDVVRRTALQAANQMSRRHPDPTLVPSVRAMLGDRDPSIVQAAAQFLGTARDRDSVPLLLELLEHEDPDFRRQIVTSVITAVGTIGDPSARKPLEAFARDPGTRADSTLRTARVYAVQALLRIAGEDEIPLVRETLKEVPETFAAQILLQTLLEVPGRARVRVFREALDHEDRIVAARAAQGLGQSGAEEAAPALVAHLENPDSYLRQSVLEALAALGSAEAAPGVLAFLEEIVNPDGGTDSRNAYHVRLAVEALGAARYRPAASLLVRMVKARSRFAEPAALALSRIGGAEARAAVSALLEDRSSLATSRPLAVALARLGDTGPLEELHRLDLEALRAGEPDRRLLGFAADSAIRLGRTEEALRLARRRIEAFPDDLEAPYDLACVLALAGEPDAALTALEKAVAGGYRNVRQMARDEDLRSLHGKDAFVRLLARANGR